MSTGRDEFMRWLSGRRQEKLHETTRKYEALPANIRAAIARVAGVQNAAICNLSSQDRAALWQAVKGLRSQIDNAYAILLSAQTLD